VTLAGNAHFSDFTSILAIKSKSNLDPKDFSVIVVGDVLNNQERHDEYGHSGSDRKRDAGTPDISSVAGNRPNKQVKKVRPASK
jgi:hypothetical protein